MKNAFLSSVRVCLRAIDMLGAHSLVALFACVFVSEIRPDGSWRRFPRRRADGLTTLLVIDMGRFRGDDALLAATRRFRCLRLSSGLRRLLLDALVPSAYQPRRKGRNGWVGVAELFAQPDPGSRLERERRAYRRFLSRLLPKVYDRYGIVAVINNDDRFMVDRDILQVSSETGYAHICLYREAMHVTPPMFENARQRHENLGRFTGDLIVVQNRVTADMFVASGYAARDQIRVCGCMRMDDYLRRIQRNDEPHRGRKRVAFFTMPEVDGYSYEETRQIEFRSVTRQVMRGLARVALARPDVDIVVKLKDLHLKGGGQQPILREAVEAVAGSMEAVPNVRFETARMAAHDLILSSDVVCAMQSTAVLEAAIAERPVILPMFDDLMAQEEAEEIVMYHDQREWFETPVSEDELVETVLRCLDRDTLSATKRHKYRELFAEYVSPLDATATDNVVEAIHDTVSAKRRRTA